MTCQQPDPPVRLPPPPTPPRPDHPHRARRPAHRHRHRHRRPTRDVSITGTSTHHTSRPTQDPPVNAPDGGGGGPNPSNHHHRPTEASPGSWLWRAG